MIKVEVNGIVTTTCFLSKEDSEKVKKYAKKHDMDLIEAVEALYYDNQIDLYKDSVESDYSTEEFNWAEEEN